MAQQSIQDRLAGIQERIAAACERAGRNPADVTLVGASKRQPIERLEAAYEAGLRHFGENRVHEGEDKKQRLPGDVCWHLIGPLQSNKAAKAAAIFDVVHSVDRPKIMKRLANQRVGTATAPTPLEVFLEVNLGNEESKHGFAASALEEAVTEAKRHPQLQAVGLMAIPPRSDSEADARRWFQKLRSLRDQYAPDLASLSMGMSADFEWAIEEGATHVRIGTGLFGPRD